MSTFSTRKVNLLPAYTESASGVKVVGVRKDNGEAVLVDQESVIQEAILKVNKPYYGVVQRNWRSSLSQTLEAVNPELMTPTAQPWWERIRSFVENPDGSVKYYLDKNDSRYKEGGTVVADLTGRDGNVMVEIPSHYLRVELRGNDRYRLYSDIALPGFTLIPRMVMSKFLASRYTGTTVAGSALVQDGMVSNCLLKWDDMSYMQVVSGAESPVMRHTVQDTVAGQTVSYRTPYFGVFDAGIADNVGLVADPDWYALAEACRGGDVSGTTLDETYHSELGMPRTGMNRAEFRMACDAVNTEHGVTASYRRLHAGAFHVLNELAWGARCKYLNYDIQNVAAFGEGTAAKLEQNVWEAWGGGQREPFIPNGVTAPLGDNTGYVTYKLEMVDGTETTIKCGCLFGVELPLGYLWQVCDDLLCYAVNGEMHAYLCDDPAHYFHPGGTTAESWAAAHGYALVAVMPLGGSYFIARESMSGDGLSLPMEIGGSGVGATAGTGDLYTSLVASSTGWFGPFLGGRADLGAGAGLGSMSLTLYPSKGSVSAGCRICRG